MQRGRDPLLHGDGGLIGRGQATYQDLDRDGSAGWRAGSELDIDLIHSDECRETGEEDLGGDAADHDDGLGVGGTGGVGGGVPVLNGRAHGAEAGGQEDEHVPRVSGMGGDAGDGAGGRGEAGVCVIDGDGDLLAACGIEGEDAWGERTYLDGGRGRR